ncbi:TetR/AcrR family transcriptional regulator [Isoptericola dokdonensis]|uniref:HTH-type transcriptional repressor AcnR n=1 Tax=Isoptericola dokdonensis DS-3 TaxID=1300344 RepID=A0A161I7Z4_9MICO|nr:TetR family transcriptional regulator [Isoptericola dokdonensis]ANC31788.1 HTH-type transcriptional repressor AcnR [Isoptericola dokdonensis DS-3]
MTSPRRTGRRPGSTATRQEIVEAARAEFAAHGFRGATLRRIAARAEVDPALVHHYFGDKDGLFAATVTLPDEALGRVLAALGDGVDCLGERLTRTFLGLFEAPATRDQMLIVVRSALTHDVARDRLRDVVEGTLLAGLAGEIPEPERRLRIELAMTQVVGLVLARYVLVVAPLCDLPLDDAVALVAPAVQRHLTGPLPAR